MQKPEDLIVYIYEECSTFTVDLVLRLNNSAILDRVTLSLPPETTSSSVFFSIVESSILNVCKMHIT